MCQKREVVFLSFWHAGFKKKLWEWHCLWWYVRFLKLDMCCQNIIDLKEWCFFFYTYNMITPIWWELSSKRFLFPPQTIMALCYLWRHILFGTICWKRRCKKHGEHFTSQCQGLKKRYALRKWQWRTYERVLHWTRPFSFPFCINKCLQTSTPPSAPSFLPWSRTLPTPAALKRMQAQATRLAPRRSHFSYGRAHFQLRCFSRKLSIQRFVVQILSWGITCMFINRHCIHAIYSTCCIAPLLKWWIKNLSE